MSVTNRHKKYEEFKDLWMKCRVAVEGSHAVKDEGDEFLPKPGGQGTEEYKAYKKRALWYGATGRTLEAMVRMVFREAPEVRYPDSMDDIVSDITQSGESLTQFARGAKSQTLTKGRGGVLVDYPARDEDQLLTKAQAQELGMRPYMTFYDAESIVNWQTERIGGEVVVSMVVLEESYTEPGDSKFVEEEKSQYRVLELVDGEYHVEIHRENEDGDWEVVSEYTPKMQKKPLDSIPFVFLGTDDTTPSVDKPPILDLVDVNISHYQTSAIYEHGMFFTGLPTAVVTGVDEDRMDESWRIGSLAAWMFTDSDADAKYLEFTGEGLAQVQQSMDDKEEMMAFLGAQMLSPKKKEAESAEAKRIQYSGEQSIVAKTANSVSDGLTQAFKILAKWNGSDSDEVSISLNTDYLPQVMGADEIKAHMELWLNGGMAFEDLVHSLQQGEVIREDREPDEIKDDIDQETEPALGEM